MVVPLRAVHALRRVVDMTVLNLSLIVVRIPSHVFVVSLLSCIIFLGFSSHAHSTARNSQLEHSRATVVHVRVSLNSENSVGDTEAGENASVYLEKQSR